MIGGDKVSFLQLQRGTRTLILLIPNRVILSCKAELFVTVGLDLETGWSPSLLTSSRNNKIQKAHRVSDASENVNLLQVPSSIGRVRETFIFMVILIIGWTHLTEK
jgi:zinc/manganese transport system substrate-binding protein